MRVLVIGGTRFVGPHLVSELLRGGHEVLIFHRGETESALTSGAQHVHGNLADFVSHLPTLLSFRPDSVVDLRALRREDGRRVLAFTNVANHAVVVSSVDVYRAFGRLHRTESGPPDPVPLTEDSPLRELVFDEGYDKVGVEREAQAEEALPVVLLRLPAIHGPGDYQHRLYQYVKRMKDGRSAILLERGLAEWRWARGYVEDMAHAIAIAATTGRLKTHAYNVADPVAHSEAEWVGRIAAAYGWDGEIFVLPTEDIPAGLRQADDYDLAQEYLVDSSRIRSELGYCEQVDASVALGRTISWELENPPADLIPAQWDYAAEDAALYRVRQTS